VFCLRWNGFINDEGSRTKKRQQKTRKAVAKRVIFKLENGNSNQG